MTNRWRRCGRSALAVALVAGMMVATVGPASAAVTVDVGIANDGSTGRNNYRPSDLSGASGVLPGEQIDFFFDNGPHNVLWVSTNPAALPDSNPTFTPNPVGTTFSVTMPATTGMYIYFCGLHSTEAEALAATDYGDPREAGMYGRIQVLADTTAPVWDPSAVATATPVSASRIDLDWAPGATDNSGTAFYDVYQAAGATNPGKTAASLVANNVSGTSYSDVGLTAGETYWYWITAVDGAGNEGSDLTASATTSSVAASDSATSVMSFDVAATLSITVTPILNFGNLDPATPGAGSTTATVQSNNAWSMSVKSIGANGTDEGLGGDDGVFTSVGGTTIPVARATWSEGGSAAVPLSDVDATVVTGMPASASTDVIVDWQVALAFDDPAGTNYTTTVMYTVTQP